MLSADMHEASCHASVNFNVSMPSVIANLLKHKMQATRLAETHHLQICSDSLIAQAQLKREGKEAAAQLVELQGQHQALQKQAHASSKVRQAIFDQHLLDVTSH